VSLENVKLHLVDSIDDVLNLAAWLGERRPLHALAFDTETTGLVVGQDRVRMCQLGDGEHGWAIPLERWGGVFEDVVRRWDGRWFAANAKFDVGMLEATDVTVPNRASIDDVSVAHHVLYPNYSRALKNMASRLIDPRAAMMQRELDEAIGARGGWTWATIPLTFQPYWSYAALDTVLTWRVGERLMPELDATGCRGAYDLENAVTWPIERMERYGAHIDVELARAKLIAFEDYVDAAEAWCLEHYDVRPGSNAAVVKILSEAGYTFTKATESGAVALDKEVLAGIDHPLAQVVLQRRRIQKLASTYLRHFVHEVDENDVIHPSINTLGARTSRMSMERPNLQNLPRRSESNPAADAIRTCVRAREGHVMMMSDFDQVEMRGFAWMAREDSMIAAFNGDVDFFVALARTVYGDDTVVKTDPRRQVVKNAGYAQIYGAGVAKFAVTAGISFERAQWVRRRWDELFPRAARFQQDVIRVATERMRTEGKSYVRCPLTQRPQVSDKGKEYALVNFLIQGASASIFKRKILELDAAGLGDWMVVPVHDEIVLDVPNEHAEDAAHILQKVMNDDTIYTEPLVPITASVSYGETWGSKEAYAL
jgi:DNA polymerase I-like protein with 3'-5' exonuclease and polymerase domains